MEVDGGTVDASLDGGGGVADGGAPDAGDGCLAVTAGAFELDGVDDVSIRYTAELDPRIGGRRYELILEFNRFMVDYVGTFELGVRDTMDGNFGSCARCVSAFAGLDLRDGGFFVSEGTMVSDVDPFGQRLDLRLTGLRLVEVTIEGDGSPAPVIVSVPVEDGACLDVADIAIDQVFPSEGWGCPVDQFDDGAVCHCNCGAYDPDCGDPCGATFPPDPLCDPTPLPVANCVEGSVCTFRSRCALTCDVFEGVADCPPGEVCGFSAEGDRCLDRALERIDTAALGELCDVGSFLCGVDPTGVARGVCDDLDEYRCRPICASDEDCTEAGEGCFTLFDDGGYCRAAPPPDG
jgi:hypothetical protein